MKIQNYDSSYIVLVTTLALGMATLAQNSTPHPPERQEQTATEAHRFVFYSILEGCFEDGLSTEDVAQILSKDDQGRYAHFIYACPLCTPVIHALEVYQTRPAHFYSDKSGASTFGSGLTPDFKQRLYNGQPAERLAVINILVDRWVSRRKSLLRLSEPEQAHLQKTLEAMRQAGMESLKRWAAMEPAKFKMSAFASVQECAVCNGACGIMLKPQSGR